MSNRSSKFSFAGSLGLFVACLCASQPAAADVTYQYTGFPFTQATAPMSTGDYVTLRLTFAEALLPNTTYRTVLPGTLLSFVASDRHNTITSSMTDIGGSVVLVTDSSGNIARWQSAFRRSLPYSSVIQITSANSGTIQDYGRIALPGRIGDASNFGQAGTWVMLP